MRLIDADKLLEKAWDIDCRIGYVQVVDVGDIEKAPTVDAEQVVRCKDCDLWNEWDRAGHESLNNLRCSCANFSGEDGYTVYTGPNDFCSYGERRKADGIN